MSYILDALRKADAQRERDPARGIHAQPVPASALDRPAGRQNRLWLWGTVGLLSTGLLAVVAWQLARPAATVVATPAVALAPAAAPALPAVPVAPVASVVPAPPAAQVLPPAPPAPPLAPSPAAAPVREAVRAAPATALLAPASINAEPAHERVLSVSELPADVQRELPKLAISGGVYSANPAQRMLIVNGQVLGEGADAAPGVRLEQIRAKTAVLSFRGYRYGVAY